MSQMRVLLDVDGVVADLVKGVCDFFGCEFPNIRGPAAYDLTAVLGYQFGHEAFWNHFDGDFWASLPKTKEADEIVALALHKAGRKGVAFVTHPANAPGCTDGKLRWLSRYYPDIPVFLTADFTGGHGRRDWLASWGTVLVDDREANCDDFVYAGGGAFLMARPWNGDWRQEDTNVSRLTEFLDDFQDTLDGITL